MKTPEAQGKTAQGGKPNTSKQSRGQEIKP